MMLQNNDISLDIDEVQSRLYKIQEQVNDVLYLLKFFQKNMNAYKAYASNPTMDKMYAVIQKSIQKIGGKLDQMDNLKSYIERLKECESKYQHCTI